jgi:hypothetical protein
MEFTFGNHFYSKFVNKLVASNPGVLAQVRKALFMFVICWLPLAIITLINGSFWSGSKMTSFIANFDAQARFLITMPILLIAEPIISNNLNKILHQFIESGIIPDEEISIFKKFVSKSLQVLHSKWTDIILLLLCYLQVIFLLTYESSNTSMLAWQLSDGSDGNVLNAAGKWNLLISRPLFVFLMFRWILRISIWGVLLTKISRLNLNIYPVHQDMSGGIGFLGYTLSFFSPIAFAFSASVAGSMADYVLVEGTHVYELKFIGLAYLLVITLLFLLPLMAFAIKLRKAREASIFHHYDFANGIYRILQEKTSKKYNEVTAEDLDTGIFSSTSDMNAVMGNVLKMRTIPFTLKDMLPFWIMAILPFIGVISIEIPLAELFNKIASFLL